MIAALPEPPVTPTAVRSQTTRWIPAKRVSRNYGRRIQTNLPCVVQGCVRKRESEACEYCVVHCEWPEELSWPDNVTGLCTVHWLKPSRCQVRTEWCYNSTKRMPPLCDFHLCKKHCKAATCSAHGINAPAKRPSGNRNPGPRSFSKRHGPNLCAPCGGPKLSHAS